MRTDRVLLPQSMSFSAWMTFLRAWALSSGATASSRSRKMTSALPPGRLLEELGLAARHGQLAAVETRRGLLDDGEAHGCRSSRCVFGIAAGRSMPVRPGTCQPRRTVRGSGKRMVLAGPAAAGARSGRGCRSGWSRCRHGRASSARVRRSAPWASRWLAKAWRSTWGETRAGSMPASSASSFSSWPTRWRVRWPWRRATETARARPAAGPGRPQSQIGLDRLAAPARRAAPAAPCSPLPRTIRIGRVVARGRRSGRPTSSETRRPVA